MISDDVSFTNETIEEALREKARKAELEITNSLLKKFLKKNKLTINIENMEKLPFYSFSKVSKSGFL